MNSYNKVSTMKKKKSFLFIITMILFAMLIMNFNLGTPAYPNDNSNINDMPAFKQELTSSNGETILFQGIEQSLNITDYGNLYKLNQEVSVSNAEELNLTYFLDTEHEWEVSKIETSVKNVEDTRNWINNSGFESPTAYRKYQTSETSHPYSQPHNPNSVVDTITETGATYMRAHFVEIGFERYYDYFYLRDGSDNDHLITDTFNITDVYSPWIPGDTMKFTYEADNIDPYYGYYMDYYEFMNVSSDYDINSDTWGFNYVENGVSGTNTYGAGEFKNATGMYVGLYGELVTSPYIFSYTESAFSELYQNFTVPRGRIIDAYLSFDYNVPFGLSSNDNYMYFKINNKKVYSKGMGDVIEAGKGIWHKTGKIYMDLWINTSEIFAGVMNNQQFNISVGIMSGSSVELSYFEEAYQNIIWFDNVSLVLTAIANSSQSDINLQFDGTSLIENSEWGSSVLNLTGNWDTNPIKLTITTLSSSLTFSLNTTLYGSHHTQSKINQQNDNGITYYILENNTVYWEFYHNFYMPSQYSDFEIIFYKPDNWEILSALDPTFQSREFEGGTIGENYFKINKTHALFPGWWKFKATSPNYINLSNTEMYKQGHWGETTFVTGDSTKIRTQINHSNEIPPNIDLTIANLTIYDPKGAIWYQESITPYSNGTIIFSDITFFSLNTTGGQYNYTILWSNGTALGGIKSNFIINHQSSLTLLKPDDAKLDLITEGFVGDVIPVRVYLKDNENNQSISDSIISYNWTDGTHFFSESALGIYETVLYTADLLTRGLHNIVIISSKFGFFSSNLTLEINLGEETNLQILESDYNIELHANGTIKFKLTDFDNDGIDGALVNISISNNSLYSISNLVGGFYNIEFSTLFIDDIGIYQLSINFSAVGYEPQYYIYQFQIIEQSVNLTTQVNSMNILENSLIETTFNEVINISARAISNIDRDFLTGGVITFISGAHQENLTETINYWHNISITCLPDNFAFGINFAYLQFEHPNYRTATFGFQILINQIEINVDPVSFEDSLTAEIGETINIEVELSDPNTSELIEGATITFVWEYGFGMINETTPGIYQRNVKLPDGLRGNYRFDLTITPNGTIYKSRSYSFIVVIGEPIPGGNGPQNPLLWLIIIGILVSVAAVLGALSLRSYVILPRKRRKEADLFANTQKFKDLRNVQAIVIIHRLSGIPFYSKSYSILEKQKKELFSGFIQAITTIGEEFTEEEGVKADSQEVLESYGVEKFIELDFKYFYCLIADKEDIRAVFILKEKSSERLKSQISHLMLALNLKLSQELENWDGSLDMFEELVPEIIKEYFELYYKETFALVENIDLLKMKKEKDLTKMEIRTLNVAQSISKRNNNVIYLNNITELVSEENKDLVIEAIESLLERKLLVPINR